MDPYLGEIRIVSFGFAPKGWALCNGQTMSINQNQALFALLGTTFGGDGRTTFQLPNIQGRIVNGEGIGFGLQQYTLGQTGGEDAETLQYSETPTHNHSLMVNALPGTTSVGTNYLVSASHHALGNVYGPSTDGTTMPAGTTTAAGGSEVLGSPAQPHENRMPYLSLNFIIALQGIFPSQN
jgi:microcystin-dependent protein